MPTFGSIGLLFMNAPPSCFAHNTPYSCKRIARVDTTDGGGANRTHNAQNRFFFGEETTPEYDANGKFPRWTDNGLGGRARYDARNLLNYYGPTLDQFLQPDFLPLKSSRPLQMASR